LLAGGQARGQEHYRNNTHCQNPHAASMAHI